MAVKGIACIGNTGDDYAIAGYNAIVMESDDPREFIRLYAALKASPARERALKNAARRTAQQYAWMKIIRRVLLPKIQRVSGTPIRATQTRRIAPTRAGGVTSLSHHAALRLIRADNRIGVDGRGFGKIDKIVISDCGEISQYECLTRTMTRTT
jgi:hypothetical protein